VGARSQVRRLAEARVQFVFWVTSLVASVIAGVLVCRALIARRRGIAPLLVAAAVALTVAALAAQAVWNAAHRVDSLIASIAICIGACAGGYALGAATLTLGATRRRTRRAPLVVGTATAETHVVVLSDEEPETYDPRAVRAVLARYEDGEIDLPPEVARPLIYTSERSRYAAIGGSPARGTIRAVATALEARLVAEGLANHVSAAFCLTGPTLEDTVSGIVAGGGRRIVVAPLAPAWSRAFTEAVNTLPSPALTAAGVDVVRADPLWASAHLSRMLAQRVLARLGADRSDDGVVLVSEGDPWEHARSETAYREQLTFFIQRVRAELVDAGVSPGRIRRAWLWVEDPDLAEAARHLAALGAREVALVPVTFPAETIATLTDIRYVAERAAADTGARVTVIEPWGNDPAVVEALRDSVVAALERERTPSA
jgi:protoheme ferro-lyase